MLTSLFFLFLWVGTQFVVGQQCPSSCTQTWECAACSTVSNYVTCSPAGVCTCLSNQGFIGNATIGNLCRCDTSNGSQVLWQNIPGQSSQPYCVNLPYATQLQVNDSLSQIYQSQVIQVFQSMIYPTPLFILNKSVSIDGIFNPNAVGRIDPLTLIVGGPILVEYFYAFAIQSGPNNLPIYVTQVDILSIGVSMTSPLPKVFNRVRVHFVLDQGNGIKVPVFNFTISGTFTMGADGRIIKADQILHIVGFLTDKKLNNRTQYAINFCNQYQVTCNSTFDPTGFYSDFNDCFNYVTSSVVRNTTWNGAVGNIPINYNEPGGNTIVCRQIHLNMAKYDPVTHCPHSGKTGFQFCTDNNTAMNGAPGPYYVGYDSAAQQFD